MSQAQSVTKRSQGGNSSRSRGRNRARKTGRWISQGSHLALFLHFLGPPIQEWNHPFRPGSSHIKQGKSTTCHTDISRVQTDESISSIGMVPSSQICQVHTKIYHDNFELLGWSRYNIKGPYRRELGVLVLEQEGLEDAISKAFKKGEATTW